MAKFGCDGLELDPAMSDTREAERPDSSAEPELAGDWLRALDLVLGRGEAGSAWVLSLVNVLKCSSLISGRYKP